MTTLSTVETYKQLSTLCYLQLHAKYVEQSNMHKK